MTHKLEPTSDVHRRMHATSFMGDQMLEIGVSQPPVEAGYVLPEQYGMPLFELLVVDTDYVFISWELTQQQLEQAHNLLGEKAFRNRRLQLRFHAEHASGSVLLERELYGDIGRWFVRISQPGAVVVAQLGYAHGDTFHVFNTAGPVVIPRVELIEPACFEELEVSYGFGMHGRLMLLGTNKRSDSPWPDNLLPPPDMDEYAMPRLAAVKTSAAQTPEPGLPSSLQRGASPRPSSHVSSALGLTLDDHPVDKGDAT
jgi:hypothetical protein